MTEQLKTNFRPLELVFVRHGESEGNVATQAEEEGDISYFTDEFRNRHSSSWDLTEKGVEQAKLAGIWIKENINGGIFDGYYVSTYIRARKTAGYLELPNALWHIRDYIREQDWGILDVMTNTERWEKYPEVMAKRKINRFYFASPGGESLSEMKERVRAGIIDSVHRKYANQRAIIVSHGNVMWPTRMVMEDLLVEDYEVLKKDPMNKIHNCQILQYTRIDPEKGDTVRRFEWMKSICPWDLSLSPNIWQPVNHKRYTNEELIDS